MTAQVLRNARGAEARILARGGILASLRVPDGEGRPGEVVLGHPDPAAYARNPDYLGALVGRYANRIARGRFTLDGVTWQLDTNEGPHHLHGGVVGLDSVRWVMAPVGVDRGAGVVLHHVSPAGHGGYPGRLDVTARYALTDANELIVDFEATSDAPTPVNLTHHSYFALGGPAAGDIRGHVLTVEADRYVVTGEDRIPTGELRSVDGTPFDFRSPTALGARLDHPALRPTGGYDVCFALRREEVAMEGGATTDLPLAATLRDPGSGRVLEIRTSEPGLHLYTGQGLHPPFPPFAGVALEAQHFPDAPNHPHFPSTILRPGETLRSRTVHAFSTRE